MAEGKARGKAELGGSLLLQLSQPLALLRGVQIPFILGLAAGIMSIVPDQLPHARLYTSKNEL